MNATYYPLEILRTFRNRRFFVFSLIIPVLFFYLIAGSNKDAAARRDPIRRLLPGRHDRVRHDGSDDLQRRPDRRRAGGRLEPPAADDSAASQHLLQRQADRRVHHGRRDPRRCCWSPASPSGCASSSSACWRWSATSSSGLIPFAALGIFIGHKFTPDSIGPILGGGVSVLAFLGGAWGPVGGNSGFMHDLSQATPTYWLVQAGHTLIGGPGWTARRLV